MEQVSEWLPPRGGSDILEEGLRKRINFDNYNANLILSRCVEDLVNLDKKNILWQHLNYNEPLTQGMTNKYFLRSIDAFVYISHWQYEKFRYVYSIPTENVFIIKNAIEPIEFIPRDKGEKIRLIYTSAPFRGLNILLDAFEMLDRDDVELDVYSSTIIYGTDYDKKHADTYEDLFNRAQNMPNVNYHGYASNEEVIRALQRSHIFAFPSMFEETCCLAMIEAGAAGCSIVSHNLGAIYETASEFGTLLPIRVDEKQMAKQFASALSNEIDNYWSKVDYLKKQSEFFNVHYSWDAKIEQWESLLTTA